MKKHKLFFLSCLIIIFTLMFLSELALAQCTDTDRDGVYIEGGVCGQVDNCPDLANPDQMDMNGDGIGDACQPCRIVITGSLSLITNETTRTMLAAEQFFYEFDGCGCAQNGTWNATSFEGIWYGCDAGVCMSAWGPYSIEICLDGTYDIEIAAAGTWDVVCDDDFDGVENNSDNCPNVANSDQEDFDDDGEGDICDDDIDGDGVLNDDDNECGFTPVDEIVDPSNGCSIEQLVPCDEDWKNHGKYVSALAKTTNGFVEQGLITEEEKR